MAGMSLSELARRTGLNRQQLHRYTNGQAIPRADSFIKICEVLDLDPWTVFRDDAASSARPVPRFATDVIGNAKNPTEAQFASGIYEVYSANTSHPDMFTRIIVIADNSSRGCIMRAVVPVVGLPPDMPRAFRYMAGFAKIKFGKSYCVSLQNYRLREGEEALVVMLILEPEEVATNLRRGVSMRFIPFQGMHYFASKVAMKRLPGMSYRDALRLPKLVGTGDLPPAVRNYFMAPSAQPFHFGPTADVEKYQYETAEPSRASPETTAEKMLAGINPALGGAEYPTEEEFPSGVYNLYATFGIEEPRILRIPFLISRTEDGGCWAYSRIPRRFYAFPVPRIIREMSGPVVIKAGFVIHIFGVITARDGKNNLSHYYRFGGLDFKSGVRLGLLFSPDMNAQAPMASRSVLIRANDDDYPKAHRATAAISVSDAPIAVQDYFSKSEPVPNIMSMGPTPRIF